MQFGAEARRKRHTLAMANSPRRWLGQATLLLCAAEGRVQQPAVMTANTPARIFAYTGFEDQVGVGVSKYSLYSIDPTSGAAQLVRDYSGGAVTTKPTGRPCVPADHSRLEASLTADAAGDDGDNGTSFFVVGMPGVGTNAPLIVHDLASGASFCDDGIENLWGVTALQQPGGVSAFAAMASAFDSAAGTFTFKVGVLSVSALAAGPSASFETKLAWDQDSGGAADVYKLCAQMSGDQLFVTFDAPRGRLFIVCQDAVLVEIDTTVSPAASSSAWTAVGTVPVVAKGFDHVLGLSERARLPVGTAGFGTGIIGFGLVFVVVARPRCMRPDSQAPRQGAWWVGSGSHRGFTTNTTTTNTTATTTTNTNTTPSPPPTRRRYSDDDDDDDDDDDADDDCALCLLPPPLPGT